MSSGPLLLDVLPRLEVSDSKHFSTAPMTLTAVSKHVRLLSDAGLVTVTKRGRTRYCRLEAVPMRDAVTWLNAYQKFWDDQFAALAQYVEEDDQ